MERRFVSVETGGIELREEGGAIHVIGHGAVFDQETVIYRGFSEVIRRGAFTDAVARDDVRGLFNHDANFVLGRNKAGTMQLREDEKGLLYDIVAPDTDIVRDLVLSPMKRGDVTGSSFSFTVETQRWTERPDDELREILKVRQLFDVGPVTFPAYPTTDAQVRTAINECTTPAELELFAFFRESGLTPDQVQAMMRRKSELTEDAASQSEAAGDGWHDTARRKLMLLTGGA